MESFIIAHLNFYFSIQHEITQSVKGGTDDCMHRLRVELAIFEHGELTEHHQVVCEIYRGNYLYILFYLMLLFFLKLIILLWDSFMSHY